MVAVAAHRSARWLLIPLLAAAIIGGLLEGPATGAAKGKREVTRKKPPYKMGPTGGDEYNDIQADPENGTITILRLYPEPGPLGCPDSHAAWANFKVVHRLKQRRIRHVAVKYEDLEADGYVFLTVTVKQRGKSIGYRSLQGPAVGQAGILRAKLNKWPRKGELTVLFGLQVSSNCPQGEASSVSLPQVNFRQGRVRKR